MLKRAIIFVHRWLGVGLCSIFLLWFPSGIAMMYWDFPSVASADRMQRSPPLDAPRITVSPERAFAALGTTKADIEGILVTGGEYLHGVKPDKSSVIAVSMAPDKSGIFDYNLLSESDLEKGVEEFVKKAKKDYPDSEITSHSIYKQGQAIYICMDYTLPEDGHSYRAYVTVINDMVIQIKMSSEEQIAAGQQDMLKSVIDSITFTEIKKKPFSISQYWWAIVIAGALLIAALRISKVRKKIKAARDGNNAAK
jgi:hypothetical protein